MNLPFTGWNTQQFFLTFKPENVDVIWQRRIIAPSGNVAQQKLSQNGKIESGDSRVSATVRQHRVGDKHQFEYGLFVKDLQKSADEGMYDCQVIIYNWLKKLIITFFDWAKQSL